jgi:GAG-pre-integrase domain
LDSGATNHVTKDINHLSSFYAYKGQDKLQVGNELRLSILNIGSTSFTLDKFSITLNNILHVPSFCTNIISISKLLQDNPFLHIDFNSSLCSFKDPTLTSIHHLSSKQGLYYLNLIPSSTTTSSPKAYLGIRSTTNIWRARLGHPSSSTTIRVINSNSLPCIREIFLFCNDCIKAKAHVLPFSYSSSITSSPLELIHSDVWGPSPLNSSHGYKYYVTFIDDFSNFTWIYFMKNKSELCDIFSQFKCQIENLLSTNIKTLRTDGGTEYKPIANKFPQLVHETACPYTPQQNGVAERKHRHIVELSLATISHASIPLKFWDGIFSSIVYLINRLPSKNDIVPYTKLFNKTPKYLDLKVLGCSCFPYTRPYNKNKLE